MIHLAALVDAVECTEDLIVCSFLAHTNPGTPPRCCVVTFRRALCILSGTSGQQSKQSSKNANKPKKSVGKSLLKKTFPSVVQAIKKQVRLSQLTLPLYPATHLLGFLPAVRAAIASFGTEFSGVL